MAVHQIPDLDSIHNHICEHCKNRVMKHGLEEYYICEKPKRSIEEVVALLETAYKTLEKSNSCSLLKKFLTRGVLDRLKRKKTNYGSTLLDCIKSGVDNLDSEVGVYCIDIETYSLYADLFDPILDCYHLGFRNAYRQPPHYFGDVTSLPVLDGTGEYVLSVRIKACRNLEGLPLNPWMSVAKFREVEETLRKTLVGLTGEWRGTYRPLKKIPKKELEEMTEEGILYKTDDRFLSSVKAFRYWPTGRSIFYNETRTFIVWVNGEDHLAVISVDRSGDLIRAYTRLAEGMKKFEKEHQFRWHKKLGFITLCPTHLGTALRVSALVKLPKLEAKGKVEDAACTLKLQVRGTKGRHTKVENSVFEISSKKSLGINEYHQVKEMAEGIIKLINMEKQL